MKPDLVDEIDALLEQAEPLSEDELYRRAFERVVGCDGGIWRCHTGDRAQIGHRDQDCLFIVEDDETTPVCDEPAQGLAWRPSYGRRCLGRRMDGRLRSNRRLLQPEPQLCRALPVPLARDRS